MQKIKWFLWLVPALFASCADHDHHHADREEVEKQVMQAEKDFEKMAAEKGIAEAFAHYADSNAVIKRENDTLVMGKDAIRHYYSADWYKQAKVNWSPDHIEISEDGSMASTYGKYRWQSSDSSGKVSEFNGVFHTVWKRQADGGWKYIWD